MSIYRDSVLARLEATRPEMGEDEDSPLPSREPSGGLDPYASRRQTPGQLARQARRGRYTIGL